MENIDNIMQLCRLCLVKEQVNVPIFGQNNDIEQISAKISSCLPVKVSLDDSLPKKICDDCSYKLDLLYVFRNTSINSEKQLYQWLEQAGISKVVAAAAAITTAASTTSLTTQSSIDTTVPSAAPTSILDNLNDTKSEISVKQEKSDSTAGSELSTETQEYLLQQQKLPYQENFGDFNTETNSTETEEPARKKPRRAAASKPPIKDNESDSDLPPTKAEDDSEEEEEDIDDIGDGGMDEDDDDDEEEEDDGVDHPEFVDVPSTSAEEQPGPSGVNKDPIAAPCPQQSLETHHQCPQCLRVFKKKPLLRRHLLFVHTENRPYSCNICNKSFKHKDHLKVHQNTHDKTTKFVCDICQKTTATYSSLKLHQRRHLKDYRISCEICGQGFVSKGSYKTHMEGKHIRTHLCNICGKSFYNKHGLDLHMKLHEENYTENRNIKCEFCPKTFLQILHLKHHVKRMHNDNPQKYICDLCGKEITTLKGLRDHRNIHLDVKSFECGTCGKKFVRRLTLVNHLRTHTGEKPYICNVCGKAFTQQSPLTIHLRTHSGEKPYNCNICDEKFVSKHACDYHMKKKHQKL